LRCWSSPVRSYSARAPEAQVALDFDALLHAIERMPKMLCTSMMPIPRISMWCRRSAFPVPMSTLPWRRVDGEPRRRRRGDARARPGRARTRSADAALAGEQQADTVDVDQATVQRRLRREDGIEVRGQRVDERRGRLRRSAAPGTRRRRRVPAGRPAVRGPCDHDAGQGESRTGGRSPPASPRATAGQVGDLVISLLSRLSHSIS